MLNPRRPLPLTLDYQNPLHWRQREPTPVHPLECPMTDLEDSPHDGQRLDAIRRARHALGLAAGVTPKEARR